MKACACKDKKPAGYARGGTVKSVPRITGVMPNIKGQPLSPLEKAKRNNGIPGYKAGGKVKKC